MIGFFGYFKDGAVIQRGERVTVRGFCDGEVICTLSGGDYRKTVSATVTDGRFSAEFPAVNDTRTLFLLTAECRGKTVSAKVRFGDVYLALGQSNMSYCLSATEEFETWLKRAAKAKISLLRLDEKPVPAGGETTRPAYPQEDFSVDCRWTEGGDGKIEEISALCVQSAVLLSERQGIPVGFVDTSMGGLSVEAYLRRELAEGDPQLLEFLRRAGRYTSIEDYNTSGGRNYTQLSGVWNEKVAPLLGLRFKGLVWYLGESSAYDFEYAQFFLREMNLVVSDFRRAFGEVPFVAVHIAPEYYPYGDRYGYLYINEALTRLQKVAEGVISVPVYDVEPRWRKTDGGLYYHPIHTVNKAPVARRIADALDGTRTRYPRIVEVNYGDGEAICTVADAKKGLAALPQGRLYGFTLAGVDGKYYPATAEIKGDKLRVTSPDVVAPAKLTYAFMQYQDFCKVKDGDGAPLLPYRTDTEAVGDNYCFPPAYTVNGATEVYENNFGWQVGTCRKVAVWRDGTLYDGAATEVRSDGDAVSFTASPSAENYFFFGVSPALCLTGHKNHIRDYKFWNFLLKSDGETEFFGVIFRTSDGEIYRFALMNGDAETESLSVGGEYRPYTVAFGRGQTGDSASRDFTRAQLSAVVEAEFLFRAKQKVTVRLKDLFLSDRNLSKRREKTAVADENTAARSDIKLPEKKGADS